MSLSNSSFIIKNDGTLWGCGQNDNSQLGLGEDISNKNTFTQIITNTNNVKSVYCGGNYSFILKNDNTLWGCGDNNSGQLGLGDVNNRNVFTIIGINTNDIKSVYCGYKHAFILKNDGTLWGCGDNSYGQLGLGDKVNRTTFTQITTNTDNIKTIYCSLYNTLMLKNDGTLWGCGNNNEGQLGLRDITYTSTFTQITTNVNNIKSVYCGSVHTLILKNDGTLWGCGTGQNGRLGLGDTNDRATFTQITINTDNIKSIYCGGPYTFILKNDSTLWACGYNTNGELGLGDTTDRTTFTQIITNTNNIKSIYCGYNYTLILKNDGTLWGCGGNTASQLGLGDDTNRTTFTQVTTNVNDIKYFANEDLSIIDVIKIYDSKMGLIETLDINNFRNIPIDKFEKLRVLYVKPDNTILNCIISFDKKQTWKTFNGNTWITVSDTSGTNIIVNCMGIEMLNSLDKKKLIQGGFTGDLDFKCVMKTNDVNETPSITKIYIEY